jgi:hypothetical protein
MDNGFALGVDYVPMDVDLGKGSRTDADGDDPAENDDGARSAEAHIDGLTTIYAHVPLGPMYGILGYHDATIKTKESLPTSSYGDVDLNGIQYGLGYKTDKIRLEVAYSDFDDIDITATGNTITGNVTGQNKISADADVLLAIVLPVAVISMSSKSEYATSNLTLSVLYPKPYWIPFRSTSP